MCHGTFININIEDGLWGKSYTCTLLGLALITLHFVDITKFFYYKPSALSRITIRLLSLQSDQHLHDRKRPCHPRASNPYAFKSQTITEREICSLLGVFGAGALSTISRSGFPAIERR